MEMDMSKVIDFSNDGKPTLVEPSNNEDNQKELRLKAKWKKSLREEMPLIKALIVEIGRDM